MSINRAAFRLRLPWANPASEPRKFEPRHPRQVIAWFLIALLSLHIIALLVMDVARPALRDPQYGMRVERLQARVAEHPGRPLVVVLGSSRVAMGVRPHSWEEACGDRSRPLIFNMGRHGGGPLFQLMALRRLLADGVKPDAIAIEYWPALLCEVGAFDERPRLDASRLRLDDRSLVHEYHTDADDVEREMWSYRLNPLYTQRQRWLAELAPSWLPSAKRVEPGCRGMDAWGWVPGLDHDPAKRSDRVLHFEPIYREHFERFHISPLADRALRECVQLARRNGVKVAIVSLPESSEFRQWYTPAAEQQACNYLALLRRELSLPIIDARCWLEDECLSDGIHLTPAGAARFTIRLGSLLAELDWHAANELR